MIYIKGMDMPVDCLACRIACDKESYMVIGRPPKCPLAEAPDGDLIGRAETIEAVELMEIFLGERKKNAVIRGIQALPSAEYSQGWIPITESEPNTSDHVLVTYKWDGDDYEVSELDYWVTEYEAEKGNEECKWLIDHVTAWMPLPEPYREEGEVKE